MIMQLADEDQLSLETTVAEVLPGARLGAGDVGGQVTIRHLLGAAASGGDRAANGPRGGSRPARRPLRARVATIRRVGS